ncbi:outer membrane lipoprotein-sorting protein [Labilibacter sediminis]|nr:outer membrane lipoprotein-sorting protein [Labilibacter sediminis]
MKNLLILTGLLLGVMVINAQSSLTAKQIAEKAKDISEVDALEMVSTLTIIDAKGRERVRKTSSASKKFGEQTKTLMKFLAPADVKGTGMLIYDNEESNDDMWIYMPALRKTRRIVSSDKSKSFMGSEFANSDMSIPSMSDFNYTLGKNQVIDGQECYEVISTPVNEDIADENGSAKRITYISVDKFLTLKQLVYDLDEDLWKEMTYSGYYLIDTVNKKYMAKKMEVKNVQNDRRSIMTMDKVQLGSSLTESHFTTSYLEK